MENLVFLKWGGSLITDKHRAFTPRADRMRALAQALRRALETRPDLRLVLGHGSGSFGHRAALEHPLNQDPGTNARHGGFIARAAARLHALVMDALLEAGVPAASFPPSAAAVAQAGRIEHWPLAPLLLALRHGLVPVVYGDAVLDRVRGAAVVSTEGLFQYLARHLKPARILLAGTEAGVWADFPHRTRRIDRITPGTWTQVEGALQASAAPDVTGGMREKVRSMLALVEALGLTVWIFDGQEPENVYQALVEGRVDGTCLCPEHMP